MKKMSDGVLSQEEIDALLRSSAFSEMVDDNVAENSSEEPADISVAGLSDLEQDAVAEVTNIIMGSAATALSGLLGKNVEITTPVVQTTDFRAFSQEYPESYLQVNIDYTAGVLGTNVLMLKYNDACLLADLVMSGDGQDPPTELNEIYLSAISEAMNQMMGSASTALAAIINDKVEISPPSLETIDLAKEELKGSLRDDGQTLVKVSFRVKIDDLFNSEIVQLVPIELSRSIIGNLMDEMNDYDSSTNVDTTDVDTTDVEPVNVNTEPTVPPVSQVAAAAEPSIMSQAQEKPAFDLRNIIEPSPVKPASGTQEIPVQPVQFAPLQTSFNAKEVANIDLIMDVPLQITVELGKSKKTIREILALGPGSVIELDKLAGEPVDLLVNGKLLARGEVVVIDENFGIRVSDIISQLERVNNLQ